MRRSFFIAMVCILLSSCGENVSSVQSLGHYDMPVEPDSVELVYTYAQSDDQIETIQVRHHHINDYVLRKKIISIDGTVISETYYKLTGTKLSFLKEYQYEYADGTEKVQGDIKTYKGEPVGKKFEDLYCTVSFTNRDGFRKTFNEFMTYEKDTVLLWNDVEYQCIKICGDFKESKVIKFLPFVGDHYEYKGVYYYAKGIGIIKSVLYGSDWQEESNLVSIERKKSPGWSSTNLHAN